MVKTKDIPQSRTQKNAGDLLLGSLSNSDRDSYENVTFKKSEFALLKFVALIPSHLIRQM